jgi:hypothetical protein
MDPIVHRTSKRIFRFLDPIYNLLDPLAYPMIRFVAGAMMIPHGMEKCSEELKELPNFLQVQD